MLRQQRGFRRARPADTVAAALVGACDGELPVGAILDAVAQLLDADAAETRATYLPVVRELVDEGSWSARRRCLGEVSAEEQWSPVALASA